MSTNQQQHIGKLSHSVIVRAPGLLPMLYKVSELAEELDMSSRVMRRWIKNGMPHERDSRGHIWINGTAFAQWVECQRHKRQAPRLKKGQAYCVRCRQVVEMTSPTRHVSGKRVILKDTCPHCGTIVNKAVSYGESA